MELPSALVTCPACALDFEGHWTDDSDTVQDMDGPPVAAQTCPGCGQVHLAEYPYWSWRSEAG